MFKHVSVLFGILQFKKSNSITSEVALKSFVTAVNHLRGNVVKYWNKSEQSEAITEYTCITSQQAKRPRRAATHASVSHLQLQSCSDGIQNFKNRFSFVSNSLTTVSVLGFKVLRTGSKLGCSLKKKKKKVFTQNHFLHSEQTSAAD